MYGALPGRFQYPPRFVALIGGVTTSMWMGGGTAVVVEDDSPKTPKKPTPNATERTSKATIIPPMKIRISFLGP
jgi:hypothetical protein